MATNQNSQGNQGSNQGQGQGSNQGNQGSNRGFGTMDDQQQRDIARKGGHKPKSGHGREYEGRLPRPDRPSAVQDEDSRPT